MTNYFEIITRANSEQLIHALLERFPDLATVKVNYWEKDGAVKRFYFNGFDGGQKKSFNLNIKERTIFVNEYEDAYWNELLGVDGMEEFKTELLRLVEETLSQSY
ncbi:MAG: hypothetical protein ACXAE3_03555 [Candidatus Kariarchaeaceae archaeon]